MLCPTLLVLSASPATAERNTGCEPLKIGAILPLSGPGAAYGTAGQNGLRLGFKDSMAGDNIKIIYEDDQFDPAKSVAAAQKLISSDKVDVLICGGATPCNAVAPIAQNKKVPLLAWASDPGVAVKRNYVLRTYISGQQEGAAIAVEALRLNYSRIALITSSSDYTATVREGIIATLPNEKLVYQNEILPDTRDFRTLLTKIKETKADSLGLCVGPGQSGLIAKQARELGMNLNIFGCFFMYDPTEAKLAGGALNGTWLVTDSTSEDFHAKYLAEFKNDAVLSTAARCYDVALILQKLAKQCIARDQIIPAIIEAGTVTGASQTYKVISKGGDQYFDLPLVVRRITDKGIE